MKQTISNLVECEKCAMDKITKPQPNCDVCDGYGWLIDRECDWHEDCINLSPKHFTTEKLPKKGDWFCSKDNILTHSNFCRFCKKVKMVEIKDVVKEEKINIGNAEFNTLEKEKVAVVNYE